MSVTFLIGNGFDLRMGMKTRYIDMYGDYINMYENDEVIQRFKMVLRSDAPNGYTNWCDFEAAMGICASGMMNEGEFIKCVRHFKSHMVAHLKSEEERFIQYVKNYETGAYACAQLVADALNNFYKGQTPNVINEIEGAIGGMHPIYNFITFNYTKVLDYLLSQYGRTYMLDLKSRLIHIHGSLDSDVVLGVDNDSQFEALKYPITRKLKRAFVKPEFNAEYDFTRVLKAQNMIKDSDVICVYGMSLGVTDDTWVQMLASWLLEDSAHHLIYYQYSTNTYQSWDIDEKMDEEDDRKQVLLKRLFQNKEDVDKVYARVHIPVGYDIFDIKQMLESVGTL